MLPQNNNNNNNNNNNTANPHSNLPQPEMTEQALRRGISALNTRLDSDDIRAGNSTAVAPLLKEMDASTAVGTFARMITFAQTSPQNLIRWRNCETHKNRLSRLDLSNPHASLHQMRQALATGRTLVLTSSPPSNTATTSTSTSPPGHRAAPLLPSSSGASLIINISSTAPPVTRASPFLISSSGGSNPATTSTTVPSAVHRAAPAANSGLPNHSSNSAYFKAPVPRGAPFMPSNPGARNIPSTTDTLTPPVHSAPQPYTIHAQQQGTHTQQRSPTPILPVHTPEPTYLPASPLPHPTPSLPSPPTPTSIHYIPSAPSSPDSKAARIAHNAALFPQLIALGDNVLAYAYREYLEVYLTRGRERVNRYYTGLLANQGLYGTEEEERKVVMFAKERWWNMWGEREREEVEREMREREERG